MTQAIVQQNSTPIIPKPLRAELLTGWNSAKVKASWRSSCGGKEPVVSLGLSERLSRCWECGLVNLWAHYTHSGSHAVCDTNLRPSPSPQIPTGCSWSGSGRHSGGVRGHGARWGAHRPHPALWYTPLPGPVAQPALQTRRDQRAPHRAIAAEGIRAATSHPTRRHTQNQPITKQPTNWDQETVKQHKRLPVQSVSDWEQKECSGEFVLLTF